MIKNRGSTSEEDRLNQGLIERVALRKQWGLLLNEREGMSPCWRIVRALVVGGKDHV